jgi:L-ascorbate metabolism protein UlaG (beta-lactamase superfamily)
MPVLRPFLAAALFALAAITASPARALPSFATPLIASSRAPAGQIEARFMGVSTILFDDGTDQILVDGFFSRPGRLRTALGRIGPDDATIAWALDRARIRSRLRAVLVAQSHYDHALDSARIARWTGAKLVGSRSTGFLGRGEGLRRGQFEEIGDRSRHRFRDFRITAIRSPHSPGAPWGGEIVAPLRPPARASRWREGGNYSFLIRHPSLSILVQPSANFICGLYQRERVTADVVFLAIGKLGLQNEEFARDYWEQVVLATEARLVIPVHWDDFTRPLDRPLRPPPWPGDNVSRGMRWIGDFARADGVEIGFMAPFEPVDLAAAVPPRRARSIPPRACSAAGRNSEDPSAR